MCFLVQCEQCFRPTYRSCGQGIHFDEVLAAVPTEQRCSCIRPALPPMTEQQEPQQMAETVHTWSLLSGVRDPPTSVVEVKPQQDRSVPYKSPAPVPPTPKDESKPSTAQELQKNFESSPKPTPPNPLASFFDCLLCRSDKIYYH
eukprot:EG_transcript_28280